MTRRPKILASTALGLLIASAPFGPFAPLSSAASGPARFVASPPPIFIKLKCKEGESAEACALRQQAPTENAAPLPATEPQPAQKPQGQPKEAAPASEAAPVQESTHRLNHPRRNSLLNRPRRRRRPRPRQRSRPPTNRLQLSKSSHLQMRHLYPPRLPRRLLRPISLRLSRANSRRKRNLPPSSLPPRRLHHRSPGLANNLRPISSLQPPQLMVSRRRPPKAKSQYRARRQQIRTRHQSSIAKRMPNVLARTATRPLSRAMAVRPARLRLPP